MSHWQSIGEFSNHKVWLIKMKNCIYLFLNGRVDLSQKSIGVYNKIRTQVSFFENHGYTCHLIDVLYPCGNALNKFIQCFRRSLYKVFLDKIERDTKFIYIRHIYPVNLGILWFFMKIKEKCPHIKIIYELPTYPYDREKKGFKERVGLFIDRYYRVKLKRCVDIITTYSKDKYIWGIQTLQIQNGIDCSSIPVVKLHDSGSNCLKLIAVARFSLWHGYDRLIEGLRLYKGNQNNKYNVYVDFVGNGPVLEVYRNLVDKYNLNEIVHFHGLKSGPELTDVFNDSDVAMCSLGSHRKKLFLSSELKSREYLARGLPIVTSSKIDVVPDNFPYCLHVPEDDSPIDINSIISFYELKIKNQAQDFIHHEIRKFAEENCDMSIVMKPILDYIEQEEDF